MAESGSSPETSPDFKGLKFRITPSDIDINILRNPQGLSQDDLTRALYEGAKVLQREVASFAPFDTGLLQRNILAWTTWKKPNAPLEGLVTVKRYKISDGEGEGYKKKGLSTIRYGPYYAKFLEGGPTKPRWTKTYRKMRMKLYRGVGPARPFFARGYDAGIGPAIEAVGAYLRLSLARWAEANRMKVA
ncbi:MAG: hypothetical protein HQL73_02780 [Magnetococcales bacterium]|nr:hypothetical protein [Magnetococcales bacterium]